MQSVPEIDSGFTLEQGLLLTAPYTLHTFTHTHFLEFFLITFLPPPPLPLGVYLVANQHKG